MARWHLYLWRVVGFEWIFLVVPCCAMPSHCRSQFQWPPGHASLGLGSRNHMPHSVTVRGGRGRQEADRRQTGGRQEADRRQIMDIRYHMILIYINMILILWLIEDAWWLHNGKACARRSTHHQIHTEPNRHQQPKVDWNRHSNRHAKSTRRIQNGKSKCRRFNVLRTKCPESKWAVAWKWPRMGSWHLVAGRGRSIPHPSATSMAIAYECPRYRYIMTCVLSVLYWNSCTWPPLREQEAKYFAAATTRLVRRLLVPTVPFDELLHWTPARILATVDLLEPDLHIRVCRLSYFGRLIRHGPDALWALLATDQSWLQQLKPDMLWYTENCQSAIFRPPFGHSEGPDYWQKLLLDRPGCWKGLLKKAQAHALAQARIKVKADLFERKLAQALQDHHPDLTPLQGQQEDPCADTHFCLPCRKAFASKVGRAIHTFRAHGRKASARYLADQNVCDCCRHVFLNEHRLYLHLRYSRRCFDHLRARGVCQDPVPGRGSTAWQSQPQFTLRPYLVSEGPDLPEACLPMEQFALAPHELDLLIDLMNLELQDFSPYVQPDTQESMWLAMRSQLCQHPVSLADMQEVLQCWLRVLRAPLRPGQRVVPMDIAAWTTAIHLGLSRLSYAWLCPDLLAAQPQTRQLMDGAKQLQAISAGRCALLPDPGYGPSTSQPVFLHLFSGRRREGDLQCALEALDWSDSWPPVVISLDVVLDAEHGDILKPSVQAFWLDLAARGCIDGALSGPPCESWSVSRQRWYETHEGPRPLRSSDSLWGLPCLWLKEAMQVETANDLLHFCVLLHFIQWCKGKYSVLEHPDMPNVTTRPDAPSIWKLRAMELLGSLQGCTLERLHQGLFGALSPKPTGLLCAHMPSPMAHFGLEYQTRSSLPRALRMGLNNSGFYNTFQLKEYPPAFNAMLAGAFKWWFVRTDTHISHMFSAKEHEIMSKFKTFLGQGVAGPDFVARNS